MRAAFLLLCMQVFSRRHPGVERDKENSCCPALVGLQMGGWRWEGPSGDQEWHSVCLETLAQPAFSLTLCPAVDLLL